MPIHATIKHATIKKETDEDTTMVKLLRLTKKVSNFFKELSELGQAFTKSLLIYFYKFFKNIVPLGARYRIKRTLMHYSFFRNLIKLLVHWIKKKSLSNKHRIKEAILLFLLSSFFIPLLDKMLKKEKWKTFLFNHLKSNVKELSLYAVYTVHTLNQPRLSSLEQTKFMHLPKTAQVVYTDLQTALFLREKKHPL